MTVLINFINLKTFHYVQDLESIFLHTEHRLIDRFESKNKLKEFAIPQTANSLTSK